MAQTGTPAAARGDDWPQWMGPRQDDVWRETGLLERFPEGGPKVLWRAEVAGGYAGPAVADGRVFVADFDALQKHLNGGDEKATALVGNERVLCFSAADGKLLWEYDTATPVDTVNGIKAAPGGTLDMGGPVAAGGMVFVHSGYSGSAGASNLLLAFSVDGR